MAVLLDVRIRLERVPDWAPTLDSLADELESVGARIAAQFFPSESELDVVVEEGSVKTTCKILGLLYAAIAAYGSFRSGIDALVADGQSVTEQIQAILVRRGTQIESVEVRPALPSKLKELLNALDRMAALPVDNHAERERLRRQFEKIMSSVQDERDRRLIVENISILPSHRPPTPTDLPEVVSTLPEPRRRLPRRESERQLSLPSRPRRRVHRRRTLV